MLSEKKIKTILLDLLSLPSETEWIEFKEAKVNYDFKKLGKYFSALSNEANLNNKNFAWLIFGVNNKHKIVGTRYRNNKKDLNKLKKEIADKTTNRITFIDIHELILSEGRVIMFQIPAAPLGLPIAWEGHYYGREHESLAALGLDEIERIRSQKKFDWSAQIIDEATINDLDEKALSVALQKFKEGSGKNDFYDDIDTWDTITFLNKARITDNGKITTTALILLGKPEAKRFIFPNARITYIYIDEHGIKQDYEHFDLPFLLERDKVLARIKNKDSKFKILPKDSLIPIENYRYDNWSILEALNNCIAHQDYTMENKIIVTEKANYELAFFNAGSFYKGSIEDYIFIESYTPPDYRNPFLANAMEKIGMIDTVGSGIKRIFNKQRERYLPLPDYVLGKNVELIIYGNTSWNTYTEKLHNNNELDLGTVFLLDKLQKEFPIDDRDYQYIIISYIKKKRRVSKTDIDNLLLDKLKINLTEKQKKRKVTNLLHNLSREGKIKNISGSTKNPIWTLL